MPSTARPADPFLPEMAWLAGLESLGAALEVGDPFPLLLLPELALLLPELALLSPPDAPSPATTLTVNTGGGYCVKPVQVGYDIVSPDPKEVK
jgi:hypothetical protein